jgi:transcriptional regulator with XRE-family HTH domain
MANMGAIGHKTDREIQAEVGARLRDYRLARNLTQQALAERAGLSRRAVYAVETGQDPMLSTVVRILRVLGRLEALEAFLPPAPPSPLRLLEQGIRKRKRVRARRGAGG